MSLEREAVFSFNLLCKWVNMIINNRFETVEVFNMWIVCGTVNHH